ncbi:hypothetical protein H0H93_009331 [Arthromyces matolae]|nr:hypothetical protein H0H93_009331 [Arthromyces matolae]
MLLKLSTHSIFNTDLVNEDGQTVYKIKTPDLNTPGKRASVVTCLLPDDIPRKDDDEEDHDGSSGEDRFGYFGQVEHNTFGPSTIRFGGNEFTSDVFFRKDGWGVNGQHRVFRGEDGRTYKWLFRRFAPKASSSSMISLADVDNLH